MTDAISDERLAEIRERHAVLVKLFNPRPDGTSSVYDHYQQAHSDLNLLVAEVDRLKAAPNKFLSCSGCGVLYTPQTATEKCPACHRPDEWPHEWATDREKERADRCVVLEQEVERLMAASDEWKLEREQLLAGVSVANREATILRIANANARTQIASLESQLAALRQAGEDRAGHDDEQLGQLRVQLAGCLTAAEGATTEPATRGMYGWTLAYQAVLDLRIQYDQLRQAIQKVLAQKFDDICWLDVYRELAGFIGVEWSPELLPKEEFLHNCQHFYDCMAVGDEYATPAHQAEILANNRRFLALRAAMSRFRSAPDDSIRYGGGAALRILPHDQYRDKDYTAELAQFNEEPPSLECGNVLARDRNHATPEQALDAICDELLKGSP